MTASSRGVLSRSTGSSKATPVSEDATTDGGRYGWFLGLSKVQKLLVNVALGGGTLGNSSRKSTVSAMTSTKTGGSRFGYSSSMWTVPMKTDAVLGDDGSGCSASSLTS